MLSKELLDILCCPLDKGDLLYEGNTLTCQSCGLIYRVEDDIPIMLIDEAGLPEGVKSLDDLPAYREMKKSEEGSGD